MKRIVITVSAVLALTSVCSADNFGSTFGSLTTAQSIGRSQNAFGGRIGVADATSFVATYTRGLSESADGRLKLGFVDDEFFETELALGADFKWQVWDVRKPATGESAVGPAHPMDLAIGGFVEWMKFDFDANPVLESETVLQIGVQVIGSYPARLKRGGTLAPYGRINIRHESYSTELAPDIPTTFEVSESQLALGLNAGVAWTPAASTMTLFGEFQFDGNDGIFLGIDFRL